MHGTNVKINIKIHKDTYNEAIPSYLRPFFSRFCLNVWSHLLLVLPNCGFPLTLATTIHFSFLTPSTPATRLSVLAS
jgi:hypothetical protein